MNFKISKLLETDFGRINLKLLKTARWFVLTLVQYCNFLFRNGHAVMEAEAVPSLFLQIVLLLQRNKYFCYFFSSWQHSFSFMEDELPSEISNKHFRCIFYVCVHEKIIITKRSHRKSHHMDRLPCSYKLILIKPPLIWHTSSWVQLIYRKFNKSSTMTPSWCPPAAFAACYLSWWR